LSSKLVPAIAASVALEFLPARELERALAPSLNVTAELLEPGVVASNS
jgi:hypothetical protein